MSSSELNDDEVQEISLTTGATNVSENFTSTPDSTSSETSYKDIEKQEEDKLKSKYPGAAKPMAGHSAFLQKRLAKGQKYFDSGDYQMAKQAGKGKTRTMPPILSVAPEIPTPESVTTRKTSVVQPSKLASNS